jgi:hypothetical protein
MASVFERQGQYEKALELCQQTIGGTVNTLKESKVQARQILRLLEQLQSNVENSS